MTFQDAPVAPIAPARGPKACRAVRPLRRRDDGVLADACCAARCCLPSRSASTGSGSPPTCGASCGRNTEIAGDSLEYNGTATELLIGFLIAIALLVPINLGFFLGALSWAPPASSSACSAFRSLFVLGQFAIYRARRYRLTRTVLRGVRCHQTGSAVRYAFCATFWWILIVLTLGLAYPFAQAQPRTLQDAPHLLWRPGRAASRARASGCSFAAC